MGKNFPSLTFLFFEMMPENILILLSLVRYVLAKFEVFIRSKFYWNLSFLPFRVSDGHFLFDFSNFCHLLYKLLFYTSPDSCVASDINPSFYFPCQLHPGWDFAPSCFCSQTLCRQLSLHKAQHAEAWKVERHQQSNFEQIQALVNQHAANIKTLETNFQALPAKQSQRDATKRKRSQE